MAVPYVHLLGDHDPIAVMAATPDRVAALLSGYTAEQIEQRPAPGKWSLRELMAHLADCEMAFGYRLRQMATIDNYLVQPFDQDRWAERYAAYSYDQAVATYRGLRAWNLAFAHTLTAEDLSRPATHPERGATTLGETLRIIAGHDLHHLGLLERVEPEIDSPS